MDNATEVLQKAMDNLKEKEPEFIEADKSAAVSNRSEKKAEKKIAHQKGWKAFAEALAKAQEVNVDDKEARKK